MKHLYTLLLNLVAVGLGWSQTIQMLPDPMYPNDIQTYLCNEASKITHGSLEEIETLDQWENVKEERYQEFIEMIGMQDMPLNGERSPLNVTYTGTIKAKKYRVEKLYYESMPGLYVPANLYIPNGLKKKAPAILYVCGHSHTQKHHYQEHAINFAENGFVCLVIETIQRGEVRGEHLGAYEKGWFNWYSKGYNPAGVEVWNGIRGLDLLSELKEVDKDNLGVTGISGGGSQSWYLPAADPRIKAAAAQAGAASLEGQICQSTIDDHCDCMMPINTYGIDFTDVGALIAPRPFMIAQTTNDLYYSIDAVRTLHEKLKPVYQLYGQEKNLPMREAPGPHSYGTHEELRAEILSFFYRELKGKEIDPEELRPIDITKRYTDDELKAYVDGLPEGDLTKVIQDHFVELATPPQIENTQQLADYRSEVIEFLNEKTFGAFPKEKVPLEVKEEFQYMNKGGSVGKKYSFVSEEGWKLNVNLSLGQPVEEKRPVLLVLTNPDAGRWAPYDLSQGLRGKMIVASFEARGIGETGYAPKYQWHLRRSAAWTGRTLASMRLYDVLRCLEALREIPDVDPDQISIVAEGEMAAVATYAGMLDEKVKALLLKNPPATQNVTGDPDGTGMAIEMLNCLQVTDLPQVTGLMFPREVISIGEWPDTYAWVEKLYETLGNSDAIQKVDKPGEWLE
ncbi:MAG: acetylxylan esterase [Cyclobacteriaceae bacterium]|nr:acetylxylan esterase [Cyclobacteriaceae bacterium SS2]